MMLSRRSLLAAGAAVILVPTDTWAQQYPSRIIRIIVPFAAGGGSVEEGLGMNLSGRVDLGILSTFSSRVSSSSGSVQFDVKISGDADKPAIFGQASAEGASLKLKDIPYPVDDIDAQITNICRCGTYPRIREAIHAIARDKKELGVSG